MGFAWFTHEQWSRLKEIADDANELDSSFEQWEHGATITFEQLRRQGFDVTKVFLDIDRVQEWCREKGLPLDSTARSEYTSELLARRDRDPESQVD